MLACDVSAAQLTGVYKRLYDEESTLGLDQAQTSALIRCLYSLLNSKNGSPKL